MLPIAYAVQYFQRFNRSARTILVILLSVFIIHNLGMFVVFHTCFDGGTWDWPVYLELLKKMTLLDKFGI
jgi:uncharacterized integral membrane protein